MDQHTASVVAVPVAGVGPGPQSRNHKSLRLLHGKSTNIWVTFTPCVHPVRLYFREGDDNPSEILPGLSGSEDSCFSLITCICLCLNVRLQSYSSYYTHMVCLCVIPFNQQGLLELPFKELETLRGVSSSLVGFVGS